jgi:hypothetical protein
MADFNEKLWHGTRTYMMSGRTNPSPQEYVAALESFFMTAAERDELIRRVTNWPGGNNSIKNATIADIRSANAVDF